MRPDTSAFADIPSTSRGHLGLLLHAAAFRVVYQVRLAAAQAGLDFDEVLSDHPVLRAYFQDMRHRLPSEVVWDEAVSWIASQVAAWEEEQPGLPLTRLELTPTEALCLGTVGLVEEEAAFGAVFDTLGGAVDGRPTVGLLRELAATGDERPDAWTLTTALIDRGLVEIVNPEAPCSAWGLRVPGAIWSALRGEGISGEDVEVVPLDDCRDLSRVLVASAVAERAEQAARLLAASRGTLVIRGPDSSPKIELAEAVARALGGGLVVARPGDGRTVPKRLGALAALAGAVPAIVAEPGPGETVEIGRPRGYDGPWIVILGRHGGLTGSVSEGAITVTVPHDDYETRVRRWARVLDVPDAAVEELASRFLISGTELERVARIAADEARLRGRSDVRPEDVKEASRAVASQRMETLADRLSSEGSLDDLVVSDSTLATLHDLVERCRHRERLAERLGRRLPGGLNRGVRILLEGPSGVGKSLTGRLLGAQLGLEVYRVDLASVVNKFIGETEKNLSRVLDRAEDLDLLLMLDEGDSLMTRRTDVRSANDRYANLETNYLLQRLDSYQGVLVVTTNAGARIDSAFRRRMDIVVRFRAPNAEERQRLWRAHLTAPLNGLEKHLEEVARYELTGGQIRNAAIHAELLSHGHGLQAPTRELLLDGVRSEVVKAGAVWVADEPARARSLDPQGDALATLLGSHAG